MDSPIRLGRYLYTTLNGAIFGGTTPPSEIPNFEDEQLGTPRVYAPGQFEPFFADVIEVKNDLFKGLKLPMEIVDAIVDFAEYWPHTTTIRRSGELSISAGRGLEEEKLLLRSYPLGYLPNPLDTTKCRMLDEASFPTVKSQPWKTIEEVQGEATDEVRNKWLLASHMKSDHPCRKIVFTIKSHDQGWGGGPQNRGTYKGSYTWFDVGKEELVAFREGQEPATLPTEEVHTLEINEDECDSPAITCAFHTVLPRTESIQTSSDDVDIEYYFHHPLEPDTSCLQRNVTANRNMQTHKIVWSCDDNVDPDSVDRKALDDQGRGRATATGDFVRGMRIGDVVTVWGKARFAAWVNVIEEVRIDIYWAV
ncbi:hypothetical protein BDZ45DRAFT_656811 [Acephala macrosclerotiorum]|nr:hypothetical protein BDZ45DRAFT_656811 [Acephala macrosclerotiorum]